MWFQDGDGLFSSLSPHTHERTQPSWFRPSILFSPSFLSHRSLTTRSPDPDGAVQEQEAPSPNHVPDDDEEVQE